MSTWSSRPHPSVLATPPKAKVSAFSKPKSPQDCRTAGDFAQPRSAFRKHRGSVELYDMCDSSTAASSGHTNSFTAIAPQQKALSFMCGDEAPEVVSPFHTEQSEIEAIKQKLHLQELRLRAFLKKLKEKENEILDWEDKHKRLRKELMDSQATNAQLRARVFDLEKELKTHHEQTAARSAAATRQKDAELAKVREELSMLQAHFQAKLEAESLTLREAVAKSLHPDVVRLTKELEAALAKVKLVTAKNVQLQDELDSRQCSGAESGRSVSEKDLRAVQSHFEDIEALQAAMAQENERLQREVEQLQSRESEVRFVCSQLFRHRCSLAMFSRILSAMRDGESFSLSVLLRSKTEAERAQGAVSDARSEVVQVQQVFEDLQNNAVAWYSQQCGDTCRVC